MFEIVKWLFGISETTSYTEAANDTADYSDYAAGHLTLAQLHTSQISIGEVFGFDMMDFSAGSRSGYKIRHYVSINERDYGLDTVRMDSLRFDFRRLW